MSLGRAAGNQYQCNRVHTNLRLVLGKPCHCLVIKDLTHELLRDLAGAKVVEFLGYIDCRTLANVEYVAKELFELRMNYRSVYRQNTGGNLG